MPYIKGYNKNGLVNEFFLLSIKSCVVLIFTFILLKQISLVIIDMTFSNYYGAYEIEEYATMKHRVEDIVICLNLFICFSIYVIIMVIFIKKKLATIKYLIDSIHVMKGGNMDNHIAVNGNDEISHLSKHINELREQLYKKQQEEDYRKKIHNRFLTEISHDLRTPLTSLIGYLEILSDSEFIDLEKRTNYTSLCLNRANQLNELVNTAFEHFYLTGKEQHNIELLRCNSIKTLTDILKKSLELLYNKNFQCSIKVTNIKYALVYDERLMERLFDNIFTNIIRYGDCHSPVVISGTLEDQYLTFKICNKIAIKNISQYANSTGIGLMNCKKIMDLHKGIFATDSDEEYYTTIIQFPIKNKLNS